MNFNFSNARGEEGKCEDEEDYYKILEISRDASSEEIKKAYRKLSMIHHPDKNGNKEESTIKFKLLASAYETLGNPDKKKLYDMGIRGGGNGIPFGDFENVNPFDIFNMIFGSMGGVPQQHQQQQHVHGFPPPSFIRGGMGPIQIGSMGPMGMGRGGMGIHIINSSGGAGGGMHQMHNHPNFHFLHHPQQQQQQQQQQQPQFFYETMQQQPMSSMPSQSREPITKNISITLENAYFGIEQLSINLTEFHNDATITVCIPPGINDKEVLILSNVTSSSFHFSQINIIVNIEQHSTFKRNDLDFILEKEISLKESLCGLEFTIKHINNKSFHLQHKDGTIIKHNTTKTIPGLGMTDKNKNCGNLIIVFKIIYPDKLTREQIDALSSIL
uniref:J domain-containing protein n=1 Tax=viral metagenome TaxID=1070528 RepID=A0A6C0I1M0_9ZZZZ